MITRWLVDFLVSLVSFVTGLLPGGQPPDWMSNGNGYLATVWTDAAGLGAWIPWPLAGTILAAVLVSVGIGLGIKVVRIVASFLTLGGGSAA